MGTIDENIKRIAAECAVANGFTWLRYEGFYHDSYIFQIVRNLRYSGKTGYPYYVAVKNGRARFCDHGECKDITFNMQFTPNSDFDGFFKLE